MVEYDHNTSVTDKLNKLYNLHIDLEGPYYLLFKAILKLRILIQTLTKSLLNTELG